MPEAVVLPAEDRRVEQVVLHPLDLLHHARADALDRQRFLPATGASRHGLVGDWPFVAQLATPAQPVVVQLPQSLETLVRRRVALLTDYQSAAYAKRYAAFVDKVRAAESKVSPSDALTKAVARYLFKLMAYKDEYEVARLYTDGEFEKRLSETFEGAFTVKYNLAPPLLAKRDAQGRLQKAPFGSWMRIAFKLLPPRRTRVLPSNRRSAGGS